MCIKTNDFKPFIFRTYAKTGGGGIPVPASTFVVHLRRSARARPASFGLLAGIQPSTFIARLLIGISPVPLYLRNRSFVSRSNCYAHSSRISHRHHRRHPHLRAPHVARYLCPHHLDSRRSILARTSELVRTKTLDRRHTDEPAFLRFGHISRNVAQRRGAALQN